MFCLNHSNINELAPKRLIYLCPPPEPSPRELAQILGVGEKEEPNLMEIANELAGARRGVEKGVEEKGVVEKTGDKVNELAKEVDQTKRILGYKQIAEEKIAQLADGSTNTINDILILMHGNKDKKNGNQIYPSSKIGKELLAALGMKEGSKEVIKGIQMYAYGIDNVNDKRIDGKFGPASVRALTAKLRVFQDNNVSGFGDTRAERMNWFASNVDTKRSKFLDDPQYHEAKIRSFIRYEDPQFDYQKHVSLATQEEKDKIKKYREGLDPKYLDAFDQALKKLDIKLDQEPDKVS